MREENFARIAGKRCGTTNAEMVEIEVKVKDKSCTGERRLFTLREQVMKLDDASLLRRINYAEDLLARAAITRANTDATGKKMQRQAAMDAWKIADKAGFAEMLLADGQTQAKIDSALEAYYAEHLAE